MATTIIYNFNESSKLSITKDLQQKEQLEELRSTYTDDFLTCLTYNIALLPPVIVSGTECTVANKQSSQMLRVRCFFNWLDQLYYGNNINDKNEDNDKCDSILSNTKLSIIALQEVIWEEIRNPVHAMFETRNYSTHKNITLKNRKDESPMALDGGLALYVDNSQLKIIDGGIEVFNDRYGLDMFCNKGFLWALIQVRETNKLILVVNTHPQLTRKTNRC